jgi:hypothetical protein
MLTVLLLLAMSLQATPMTFTTVAGGGDSQIESARTAVVRTPAEWSALWKDHAPGITPPAVDFQTSMVIAVFAGTRPSAGYSVEIVTIDATGEQIAVTYRERAPRPDEMVAQMLTQPYHIVRTPTRPGKVSFKRTDSPR